jgi:O-antigen/teichoic acid export membrane protein
MPVKANKEIFRTLKDLDWNLLRGSAMLSIGMAVARVLGLAFSLVLAAAFSSSDYGEIRYSIALASVVGIGTQPFGQHVIARFISKQRGDPAKVDTALSNLFVMLPLIFLLTIAIALPVLYITGKLWLGILVVFAGETFFYSYWGLSTGFLDPKRLTAAYLGSNLVQIILVFLLIQILGIRSPTLALLIYGLSYVLPLALLGIYFPLPGHGQLKLVDQRMVGELLRFSAPIWISHACYVFAGSLDLLVLERLVSAGQLGAYSLSKTLATVFIFVPTGISTLLMPKVAASSKRTHRRTLTRMLGVSLLLNVAILIPYIPIAEPFTRRVFGADYVVSAGVSVLLALFMIASGIHTLITAVFVGSGRPEIESASRILDLAVTALSCWLLIPRFGSVGAATAVLAGKVIAILTYGVLQYSKPKDDRRNVSGTAIQELDPIDER